MRSAVRVKGPLTDYMSCPANCKGCGKDIDRALFPATSVAGRFCGFCSPFAELIDGEGRRSKSKAGVGDFEGRNCYVALPGLGRIRIANGLTRIQLSRRSGISYTTISRLETRPGRRANVDTAEYLAGALRVSVEELSA